MSENNERYDSFLFSGIFVRYASVQGKKIYV